MADLLSPTLLSIGDFSRMTFLSVKTLRHYHDLGLLVPARIDPSSGYRRYSTDQLPQAQVILRLRGFGMPLDEIKEVLGAPDLAERNRTIISHLERMERQLEQTRATVASLRHILSVHTTAADNTRSAAIQHRHLEPTWAMACSTESSMAELAPWLGDARRRLQEAITTAGLRRTGPDGTLFFTEFFTQAGFREYADIDRAEIVVYVPVAEPPDRRRLTDAGLAADLRPYELPAVDVAVTVNAGAGDEIDRTYAQLGSYVIGREIGVAGPIREHHLDPVGTPPDRLRTEVAWPILPVSG
ncbi:MerR family transcriptional regulator [Microlunatus elymi]|nr:MerR family transcriptional regulator [Microlunatus elymi]